MKRKKKPPSDQSGDSSSEYENASSRKKRDNRSPETASISFDAPPSLSADMNVNSDDDFQPPLKFGFNYVAPKDLYQDLKKRSGKGTSYKPKKNLPKKDKDPIPSLNLATPASSSGPSISETASTSNTSAPAPKASSETNADDKKVSKKVREKIDKREELEKAKEEAKDTSKSMKSPTCGGTDHARSSSKNCSKCVKGKKEAFKEFTKTTVIKTSLISCCKFEIVVSEIQKLVVHITQLVFAGSIFANYYYLDQVQNKEVLSEINQNLIYQLFSVLTGRGKKANDELKVCFKKFYRSLPYDFDLDAYKGQGYSTIVSSMAKQYETLVRENISSNYDSRTCRYLLGIFSKPNHELFCGNILTVTLRKSIARYVSQKKANAEDCKWPSSVDKNDEIKSLVERTLAFWSRFDVTGAKPLTVPKFFARPHHYLKWTHEIQREMSEKQFIQENIPQQTATSGYNYRNLKAIDGVTKIKTFIAATQEEIQYKTFKPLIQEDQECSHFFRCMMLSKHFGEF
ncbi:hypothetical protein [Parasitella parasitica]|uniref:Uncharacterized protein n=1 Tax=Parasitella parasitica TaxID=35722 RepID=A0A0B7NIG6_9FUNG|nr:hypothetical protein [Parasitella parasitica]